MKEVTMCCTTCPSGCALVVTVDGDKVVKVEGNTCKRGIKFAEKELVAPERMLTSTILVRCGGQECLIPIKSKEPMPKDKMLDAMTAIKAVRLDHPVKMGEVIIPNILDCGVDIVACKSMEGQA